MLNVPLGGVEDALTALWEAAREAGDEGGAGLLRVRQVNIVGLASSRADGDQMAAVLREVAVDHPARAVVIVEVSEEERTQPGDAAENDGVAVADGEGRGAAFAEGPLTAGVTAECTHDAAGQRRGCFELVRIEAGPEEEAQIEALVAPVLVADLPTVVWVPRSPADGIAALSRVVAFADRLVVDAAGFGDPVAALWGLTDLAAGLPARTELRDLSWTRLTPWREMIGELFEPRERRSLLARIERVTVSYGSEAALAGARADFRPAAVRALLLVAWLATRLGWKAASPAWTLEGDATRMRFERFGLGGKEGAGGPGRPAVEVNLQPHRCRPGTFGGLESVVIEAAASAEGGDGATITLDRSPDSGVCATRMRRGSREERVRAVGVPQLSDAELLAEELSYQGHDALFSETLAQAAELARLPGSEELGG